ncbi:MAG: S8 family serine peptidase [Phycisphaerales bacterium]|nr:S8 family serine peptidase [Phycisphaerales bacterium]
MMKRHLAAFLALSAGWALWAEAAPVAHPDRYWVFLADKGFGEGAAERSAIESLASTYDQRAVQRRMLRRTAPGLFDARDLPVAPAYVGAIEAAGAHVHIESRWLNAVSVEATDAELCAIASLPFVDHTEPVRAGRRVEPDGSGPLGEGGAGRGFYGYSDEQLSQIGLTALHAEGYTGAGVVIGILDTGFSRVHQAFHDNANPLPVVAEWDFVKNDGNTAPESGDDPDQHSHGTLILGVIRAYRPDTLVGGAYDASVILCKTEDITSETPIEEDNYVAGLEFIEAHGGDMATSSLGYIDWYTQNDLDGHTAVTTIGVNVATANGVHCCTAAGNEGNDGDPATSHLIAPADALEAITCGAVYNEGNIVGFSSDGPSADGRVKPEVLARGVDTYTIWPYDSSSYTTASGTSLSTPLVASAVACLIQARPWWQPETLRQHLFTTASDFVQDGHPDPLFVRGYGILNAAAALADDCGADVNGDGVVNTQDVLAFLNLWSSHASRGDFNGDGAVDSRDVIGFLNAWVLGC